MRSEEECEKEENAREKEAVETESRESDSVGDFPSPLRPPPTTTTMTTATRKGGCSRRTARRLTQHIIIPLPPCHPRSTHRPPCHSPRFPTLLPVSSFSSCSSFSSRLDLFTLPSSPVATLRASIRAGQLPLRHSLDPRRPQWAQYGRPCTLDTLRPRVA